MKNCTNNHFTYNQGFLPLFISDCLDLFDPVFTFDRFMGGIDLNKYLKNVPEHITGRVRYNPVNMLKTVLFGFMTSGYCSLRELEDNCKVNLRFMYLMDRQTPSYRTFGYFINEVLQDSIEQIFYDINQAIFEEEHVDLQHIYIDGSKFEANANKYTWVWKKATEKSRYRLYDKITNLIEQMNEELIWSGMSISTNTEYVPDYLTEVAAKYTELWQINANSFDSFLTLWTFTSFDNLVQFIVKFLQINLLKQVFYNFSAHASTEVITIVCTHFTVNIFVFD